MSTANTEVMFGWVGTSTSFTFDVSLASLYLGVPIVSAPTFSPGEGAYTSNPTVTLASTTGGAAIYYTTDGSTPTTASTLYTSPFSVTVPQTVKAIAVLSGYTDSNVAMAAYAGLTTLLYLPLDETSGTNCPDSSSNTNDGTLQVGTGSATWTADDLGSPVNTNCLVLSEADQQYVSVPSISAYNVGSNDATWAFRAKFNDVSSGQYVFAKSDGFGFAKWIFGLALGSYNLYFFIKDGSGSTYTPIEWTPGFSNGTAYHICITRSGSTWKLYVDGVLEQTNTEARAIPNITQPITVGEADGSYMDGLVNDVRFYAGALNATQVMNLYTTGTP